MLLTIPLKLGRLSYDRKLQNSYLWLDCFVSWSRIKTFNLYLKYIFGVCVLQFPVTYWPTHKPILAYLWSSKQGIGLALVSNNTVHGQRLYEYNRRDGGDFFLHMFGPSAPSLAHLFLFLRIYLSTDELIAPLFTSALPSSPLHLDTNHLGVHEAYWLWFCWPYRRHQPLWHLPCSAS